MLHLVCGQLPVQSTSTSGAVRDAFCAMLAFALHSQLSAPAATIWPSSGPACVCLLNPSRVSLDQYPPRIGAFLLLPPPHPLPPPPTHFPCSFPLPSNALFCIPKYTCLQIFLVTLEIAESGLLSSQNNSEQFLINSHFIYSYLDYCILYYS